MISATKLAVAALAAFAVTGSTLAAMSAADARPRGGGGQISGVSKSGGGGFRGVVGGQRAGFSGVGGGQRVGFGGVGGGYRGGNVYQSGHAYRGGRGFGIAAVATGLALGAASSGYGYGQFAYDGGYYGYGQPAYQEGGYYGNGEYGGNCWIQQQVVIDRYGYERLMNVEVCQ